MLNIALFLQALAAYSYDWTDENGGFKTSIPYYKIPLPSPKKSTQELPSDDTKLKTLNLKEIVLPISILLNLTLTLLLVYICVCKKKQEIKCQCEQLQQFV